MKILNLYAGLGGNRKLWGDHHEITAVELNPGIANIYQDFFPKDRVIVADAHLFLLEHFKEYDFIWCSPPCPSHSKIRIFNKNQNKPIFPDMKLYEEIIFLRYYYNNHFVVENVRSYYKPLISPIVIGRHYFWSNFHIDKVYPRSEGSLVYQKANDNRFGFNISNRQCIDKTKALRNLVDPEIGLHILNCALHKETVTQCKLFADL